MVSSVLGLSKHRHSHSDFLPMNPKLIYPLLLALNEDVGALTQTTWPSAATLLSAGSIKTQH